MAIAPIVTRGYGSFGSVNLITTRGYGIGEDVADVSAVMSFAIEFAHAQTMTVPFAHVRAKSAEFPLVQDGETQFSKR